MSLQKACGIFIYFYIPPCVWKSFSFMVFAFLENALDLGIFTHAHIPHSKFQADFFENLFPPTAETGRQNYELLYQNSITNYEDDLKH